MSALDAVVVVVIVVVVVVVVVVFVKSFKLILDDIFDSVDNFELRRHKNCISFLKKPAS